jgi:hypothetical protein
MTVSIREPKASGEETRSLEVPAAVTAKGQMTI